MSATQVIKPADGVGSMGPLNATSTALEASRVVKTTKGLLVGFTVYNSKASAQFIQVHDAAALPADTAVPAFVVEVAASSSRAVDFSPFGRQFTTGIVICNSSTFATKTIGAADCWFDVQYAR